MILSTVAYAGVNTCVKQLSHWPTHQVIFFRAVISLVITLWMLRQLRVHNIWGKNKGWLIVRGLAGVSALYCYFLTLQHMPMASAVTIQYVNPIFTAIGATLILGETMKRKRWLFFLISFLGVVLVKGLDSRLQLSHVLIGLLGAASSGVAYTAIRKLGAKENALTIILYFPLLAMPITGLLCFGEWKQPAGMDWFWAILMGILTQAGQMTATKAIQLEKLSRITHLNYLGVVYALVIGFVWFGEGYQPLSLLGMGLVIGGIVLNLLDQDRMRQLRKKVLKRQSVSMMPPESGL